MDDNVLGLRSEKCVGHIGTDTRYKKEPFLDKIYIFRFGCKKINEMYDQINMNDMQIQYKL